MVPRLAGLVEQVLVSAGDTVRKGQVMAILSSQVLADQRAELLAAQQRLSLARTTYEREKKLWEEKITAEQDMLSARSAMQEAAIAAQSAQSKSASLGGDAASGGLTRYELRSPIDGVVTEKRISLGEAVKEDSRTFPLPVFAVTSSRLARCRFSATAIRARLCDVGASGHRFYSGDLAGDRSGSGCGRRRAGLDRRAGSGWERGLCPYRQPEY